MRNIEIKARLSDPAAAEAVAARLADAGPHARLHQVDTYFFIPEGRLKLREIDGEEGCAELIFYRRPDSPGPKSCDYEIARVSDPAGINRVLDAAFGIRAVVDKQRTVYLYRNVRIHLDRVRGLGKFLEIEAVEPDSGGESLVRELLEKFSIRPEDLVEGSYCDLMERAG